MIINLTEMDVPGSESPDDLLLIEAIANRQLIEAVSLIMEYDPIEVIVDVDEDFFDELREELDEEITLTLGRQYCDE